MLPVGYQPLKLGNTAAGTHVMSALMLLLWRITRGGVWKRVLLPGEPSEGSPVEAEGKDAFAA